MNNNNKVSCYISGIGGRTSRRVCANTMLALIPKCIHKRIIKDITVRNYFNTETTIYIRTKLYKLALLNFIYNNKIRLLSYSEEDTLNDSYQLVPKNKTMRETIYI